MKLSHDVAARFSNHARTASRGSPVPGSDSRPGERQADSEENHVDALAASAQPASNHPIQRFLRFVESAENLIEVHAGRIRLFVRRTIMQAAIGACAAVCLAVWLGTTALATHTPRAQAMEGQI